MKEINVNLGLKNHGTFQVSISEITFDSTVKSPHRFICVSNFYPTIEEVHTWQKRAGYHPDGYGFYNLLVTPVDGCFKVEWQCSHSCE